MATTSTTLPLYFSGKVVHGAGRGGTQLGFPTGVYNRFYGENTQFLMFYPFLANVDASCIQDSLKGLEDGVYYGYAKVDGNDGHAEPMVMSIGQNITFEDAKAKTAVRLPPHSATSERLLTIFLPLHLLGSTYFEEISRGLLWFNFKGCRCRLYPRYDQV